jgi:hypothetical protein
MRKIASLVAATVFFLPAAAMAQSSPNVNIRGVIQAFGENVLTIKTVDAQTLTVTVPEQMNVATTKAFGLSDIKPGMKLGVTTVVRPDGQVVAVDVRPISATAKPGLSPYDLQPGSTMTNAVLEAFVEASTGGELTLNYQSGQVKVLLTPQTAMSRSAPGQRSDLKVGETIYVAARRLESSSLTAVRIQVSKDGIAPTQ